MVFETEKLKISCEDNMVLMARYPDKYFNLAIVDPPYGINVNVNMGRRKGDKKSNYHKFYGNDSSIPSEDYFNALFRVSKNQIIWGGNYMTDYLYPSPCWILWDKGFSEDLTFSQFEMAWTSFKSMTKKFDRPIPKLSRIHPTEKPIKLYKWLLDKYAKPGDQILDTHCGSLSIAIACHEMGYNLTGCEIDKKYYQDSINRLKAHMAQTKLF